MISFVRQSRASRALALVMLAAVTIACVSAAARPSRIYDAHEDSFAGTLGKPYRAGTEPERSRWMSNVRYRIRF